MLATLKRLSAALLMLAVILPAGPARSQPVATTISSNFNGTSIPQGRTIWFNAHVKYTGPTSSPVTLNFTAATISFTANSVNYVLNVPGGRIHLVPSASSSSTVFDTVNNRWVTTVPSSEGGDIFIQGLAYTVPVNFPGGTNPVVWNATFSANVPSACVNWQWGAAVYTQFTTDMNAVGVSPIDAQYQAGTPENFRAFVTGGARGGGGSNFTGSNSGTGSACVEQPVPVEAASWGSVKARFRN